MRDKYYYLVSSLPFLEFGTKPPFSYSGFLKLCEGQLSEEDLNSDTNLTLIEWKKFERNLKNELVKVRAEKRSVDAINFIQGEHYPDPDTMHMAHWAINQDDILDTEASLDRFRWEKLEELKKGHYFDIDILIIYALQIKILERWNIIDSQDGVKILKELVDKESR
ncbi:MAG: DUF2764 family protein [Candidatus Omnitrophota bacterium]